MTEFKEDSNVLENKEWLFVTQEIMNSGVTKEEFKKFLEQKRNSKNSLNKRGKKRTYRKR